MTKRLLIVDDDRFFCQLVQDDFSIYKIDTVVAHSLGEAREKLASHSFGVVLLDNRLPDGEGLNCVPDILKQNENTKIILVTSHPSLENAVKALKCRIFDYVQKPIDIAELRITVENAIRMNELEKVEFLESYKNSLDKEDAVFIGSGESFKRIRKIVSKAAKVDAPVLITGQTGTGKSLLAKAIHHSTFSTLRPFVSINCAALPEHLIEVELFGAEKGAYTGSVSKRLGLFELANGGTLFLDEIGEMSLHLQSKLLGVLDEKKVRRIGGESFRPVNVRLIAATNIDLEKAIANNNFRSDLYYRLNVIRIDVPPLKEHIQDLPEICDYLLKKLAPFRKVSLKPGELDVLMSYHWPGNVRELKNILERALIMQDSQFLEPSLFLNLQNYPLKRKFSEDSLLDTSLLNASLEEVEKRHILLVLQSKKGNLSQTASSLGISLSTLKRKLKEMK